MNWNFNINYCLILLLTVVLASILGQDPESFEKYNLPQGNVEFQINKCDPERTLTEIILLDEANVFNPTYKKLVIIIGYDGTDAVDLARFLTNGNQTNHNIKLHKPYQYDPTRHAQQHLFQFYDAKTETAYFAHRGEFILQDDYLVNRFFTKKVIDYAEEVKIILIRRTTDGVENIFKHARRVLPNLLKYKQQLLLVVQRDSELFEVSNPNKDVSVILTEMSTMNDSTGEIAQYLLQKKLFTSITTFNEEARNKIKSLVNKISYAKSNKTDFVYSHSTGLRQQFIATCVYRTVPMHLSESAQLVVNDMSAYLDNLMKEKCVKTNFAEVSLCAKTIERFYDYISSSCIEVQNVTTSHEFFNKIREIVRHLNFPLSDKAATFMYKEKEPVYNYLFENAMSTNLDSYIWMDPFAVFLQKYLEVYTFYNSSLIISSMNFFNSPINDQKKKDFLDLFKTLEQSPLLYDGVSIHRKAFKTVKVAVLNKNVSWRCVLMKKNKNEYKMEVRGEIVSLSYVKSNECQNVTYIEIFALNTVVIDENWFLNGRRMQVAIAAPTWLIMGNRREIDLSGTNAEDWETAAANGKVDGVKVGAHGKPGVPGESAGHFYGIAENIINGQHLTILANGGFGGAGQRGGDGAKGEDGETYDHKKYGNYQNPKWKSNIKHTLTTSDIYIFGIPGENGHRGGNGGMGGQGGLSGEIKIFQLEKNPNHMIKYHNKPGPMGEMGIGGKGGAGGVNGNDLKATSDCKTWVINGAPCAPVFRVQDTKINGIAAAGANGKDGSSFTGREQTREVKKVQSFARIVNNYKSYARENSEPFLRNNMLKSFFTLLSWHSEIVKSYTVLDLIEEFIDLEKQFDTLANISVLFSSYDSLLARVQTLNDEMKIQNIEDEYKTIPISSMLSDLKERNNIKNIHEPYRAQFSIRNEFDNLKNIYLTEFKKASAAEKFTSIFQTVIEDIDASIEEGREVLKTIQNITADVESNLDLELESIVKKVITARKTQNKAIEDLGKEFEDIQFGIVKKIMIGMGKTLLQALAIINPALGAVGAAGCSVLNVVESSINAKANDSQAVVLTASITGALSTDFKLAEDLIEIRKKYKEKLAEKEKSIIDKELKGANVEDTKVLGKWKSLNDLEIDDFKSNSQHSIFSFEKKDSTIKADKEKLLENVKKDTGKKYKKALKVIEKLKTTTKVTEIFGSLMKDVEKDRELLDSLGNSIEKAKENMVELRKLENDIYDDIFPILEGIKENFGIENNELSKISKIRLSLVQWQIKDKLKTVKHTMESVLKGFSQNGEFAWTMEKLIEAVGILLHTEELIMELHKKKKDHQIDLSLNINNLDDIPQSWYVNDIHISRSFSVLNEFYQKNVFKRVYSEWLHAYKQFVFPYSDTLRDLPNVSEAGSNFNTLSKSLKPVEKLLNDYNAKKFPPNKTSQIFTITSAGTTRPFSIWRRVQHYKKIDKLLSGERVTFFAKITKQTYNAVKYNSIQIKFYDENNKEVIGDLQYFKFRLTHEGDSYYKCNNSIILIRNSPTSTEYGLDKGADFKGGDYDSFHGQDNVLSPYASWTIQIIPHDYEPKDFSILNQYKGKVDLALEGQASFLPKNTDKCQYDVLTRFFKMV